MILRVDEMDSSSCQAGTGSTARRRQATRSPKLHPQQETMLAGTAGTEIKRAHIASLDLASCGPSRVLLLYICGISLIL